MHFLRINYRHHISKHLGKKWKKEVFFKHLEASKLELNEARFYD